MSATFEPIAPREAPIKTEGGRAARAACGESCGPLPCPPRHAGRGAVRASIGAFFAGEPA